MRLPLRGDTNDPRPEQAFRGGHPGLCRAAETRSRSDQPSEKQSSLKLTLFRALRGEKVASFGAVEFRHQGHRKRFAVTPENMVISQYA